MKTNLFITSSAAILMLCIVLAFRPIVTRAQEAPIEITPFAGYMLGGSIKFYQGKFKILDNLSYGGHLAYRVRPSQLIEISYARMDTEGDWNPNYGYSNEYPAKTVGLAVNHLQIGTVNELMLANDAVRPFGTFTLGTSWIHGKETTAQDEWLFSVTLGAGLKYFFTPRIGIRLQADLLLPMVFDGAGFYLGVGTGGASSGVGVSTWVPIVQGNFTGGIIIALGE